MTPDPLDQRLRQLMGEIATTAPERPLLSGDSSALTRTTTSRNRVLAVAAALCAVLLLGVVALRSAEPEVVVAAGEGADPAAASFGQESTAAGPTQSVNWRTLGCTEPSALEVPFSEGLEEDVGLAADSVAEKYGLTISEAQRRLRLQNVLNQAMAEVQTAESGRVARSEFRHLPDYAAVVTLTGAEAVSEATNAILCRTPELEVRLGAAFTRAELMGESSRLGPMLWGQVPGLTTIGVGDGQLEFRVVDDPSMDQLALLLGSMTTYPYVIESGGLPPLVLDPSVPFPLLDITGRIRTGAGVAGTLTIEGPCVYIGDSLAILPARETTWDAATGVLNTGSGDLRSGDSVFGSAMSYAGETADLTQPPDPTCRLDGDPLVIDVARANPDATPVPVPPGTPGVSIPAAPVPPAPPESPDGLLLILDPPNPQAGENFAASFSADYQRGGFFDLRRWTGFDWSEPQFLLESGLDRPPTAIRIEDEGPMMQDYGVGGAGPDPLVMPTDIEPGLWRLCTANAGTPACTQITIDG